MKHYFSLAVYLFIQHLTAKASGYQWAVVKCFVVSRGVALMRLSQLDFVFSVK